MPRMNAKERKEMILRAAVRMAMRYETLFLDIKQLAEECEEETSQATIRRYFFTSKDLRDAIVAHKDFRPPMKRQNNT